MKKKYFYSSKAWKTFRLYMLNQFAKGKDHVQCCTCGKVLTIGSKDCQLGHFIKVYTASKTNFATAFDEKNVAPQCLQCNFYKGGEEIKMQEYLIALHGTKEIDKLKIKAYNVCRLDKFKLNIIAKEYHNKIDDIYGNNN